MSASMHRLSPAQKDFVQSLATLAYGHGFGEGAKGGVGNMGLAMIGGKMRVFKCNTHWDQVKTDSTSADVLAVSSNRLRDVLRSIGKNAGLDTDSINRLLGDQNESKGKTPLLTRKIVAKFVAEVTGQKESDGTEDSVWGKARISSQSKKSVSDMKFTTMFGSVDGDRLSVNSDYDKYMVNAESMKLTEVVDSAMDEVEKHPMDIMKSFDVASRPRAVKIREDLLTIAESMSKNIVSTSLSPDDLRVICDCSTKKRWFCSLKQLLDMVAKEPSSRNFWIKTLINGEMEYGKGVNKSVGPKQKKEQIFDALANMVAKWVDPTYDPR